MPIGFCCEHCFLYDEYKTCLKSKTRVKEEQESDTEKLGEIILVKASIEGNLLKVVIEHEDKKEKTLILDLKKYLEAI
ncbi:MAG: hypothetical protein ACFE75_03180 [Candidatus Hodarchaeota archaeon]